MTLGKKMRQELIDAGWVNDGTYPAHKTDENGVPHCSLGLTPVYTAWRGMKERCTSKRCKEKNPTYLVADASVEFKNFTFFHEWWYNQVGHDLSNVELDKDLLQKGNKLYSQEKCLLVPNFVNTFLTKRGNDRGECLIGVYKHGVYKNGDPMYAAQVSEYDLVTGDVRRKRLGYFRSELAAFQAYKLAKEAIAKKYAEYLKGKVDSRVVQALLDFEVDIDD